MKQKFSADNERMKECQKSGLRVVRPATDEGKAHGGRHTSKGGEAIPKDDDGNMIRLVNGKTCRGFLAVDQDRSTATRKEGCSSRAAY